MIKNLWFILSLLAGMAMAPLAHAGPGCDDYGRCFAMTIQNSLPTPATFAIAGGNCYEGQGGTFPLAPGASAQIGIARVQGHGCNGHQGYFSVVVNGEAGSAQGFQFDNSDNLGFNGASSKYYGGLTRQPTPPGSYVTYTWSPAGTWNNAPICDSGRCFPLFLKNSLATPITWSLAAGNCYEGNRPQPFTIAPGQTYQISLARVQGHGCDGKQGEFSLTPVGSLNNEAQQFNFTNDGQIALTNAPYGYSGSLSRMANVPGAFQWDLNSTSGSTTPVAGCDDKSRCFWLNLANRSSEAATFNISGGSCYEGTVNNYVVQPGQQQHIGIARVQGHGCDGHNGNFTVNINSNGASNLTFTNDASLGFVGSNPTYDVSLSPRSVANDGWYFYEMTLAGKWQNPQICGSNRCFQMYVENAFDTPITWKLNPGNCYEGNRPGQFTVQPGSRYEIALARVQGHGCDGKQGEFSLEPVGSLGGEVQSFNFSNDGGLGLSNTPKGYLTSLSTKRSNNAYTYTVDANITHTPTTIATTTGNWTNPTTKLFNFTTDGFWPNFYQNCYGYEVYHNQHVVRLPNDAAGNAYFMVAQSREHNGYITLLKVNASNVDGATDVIKGDDGSTAGVAIWQEVYTGKKNGTIDPVGNWNHPGKMAFMDGILAVTAQNWDMEDIKKFGCGKWYSAIGTSEDKVLFYDVRNITAPRYLGAMTAGQLGVPNHEVATVEFAFDEISKKYLLVTGGAGVDPVLAADSFNPSIAHWTPVPGAPGFSGQHGLAFDQQVNGARQLVYFDASRSDGAFKFTPFSYSAAAPYLSGHPEQRVPMNLPGANRDWDASSIYISPRTQKPIVYTVKSLDGTSNYQLYQVVPSN
jgi:hypothetical protein